MSLEVELLHRVEALERLVEGHTSVHPLEHHDHLLDTEEHAAHHAAAEPKERRAGEQRKGERRTSENPYVGEERRAG